MGGWLLPYLESYWEYGGGGGGSGGNHGMDWHPIKGGIVTLLVASCEESRMTSSEPGQATAQI